MPQDTAPCQKCRETISTDAHRCPNCGYDPSGENSLQRTVTLVLGALLCFTGIGLPLGLWLILKAEREDEEAEQRTAAHPS